MLQNIVTVEDIALRYEHDLPVEKEQWVGQKIREATRLLFARCPVAARKVENGSGGAEYSELVVDIICRAVLRVVRDDSPMYQSEAEDGYSYTKNNLVASGDIWFPDVELLALGCTNARRRFGSVKTRPDRLFSDTRRRRWRF